MADLSLCEEIIEHAVAHAREQLTASGTTTYTDDDGNEKEITDDVLREIARNGLRNVQIVCTPPSEVDESAQ